MTRSGPRCGVSQATTLDHEVAVVNSTLRSVLILLCLMACAMPAFALDGTNALKMTTLAGWQGFELVTQLDNIAAIADAGYGSTASRGIYDGIGAYRADGTLSLFLNHETSNAAISGVDLNLASFQQAIQSTIDDGTTPFPSSIVTRMGYSYTTIYDGSYHATDDPDPAAQGTTQVVQYGNANFDRFCSGTAHKAHTFGLGRGFADPIYLTGEEVAGGLFYALDIVKDTLWEAADLGLGNWENAAALDTGNTTHTALLLMSDVGSGAGDYIQLYVGEKDVDVNEDGQIDFLERNGMRGGTKYYFAPTAGASLTDLPDGTVVGSWESTTANALRETKLEDIHTDPNNGSRAVFADQQDGVYVLKSELVFSGGSLDLATTNVTIYQIDDDDVAPIGAPDNLTWTDNGKLYVQEDGNGDDVFEMLPDGSNIVQIASAQSEPSGIVDVSRQVGYAAGSVLLTSLQGSGSANAQLSVMVSPTATPLVRPGDFDANGDYACADVDLLVATIVAETHDPQLDLTGDGFVDEHDLTAWLAEAGAAELAAGTAYRLADANLDGDVDAEDFLVWNANKFTTTAAWCSGDFNADGAVDGQDILLWNANKFLAADHATVPEPSTGFALVILGLFARRRFVD